MMPTQQSAPNLPPPHGRFQLLRRSAAVLPRLALIFLPLYVIFAVVYFFTSYPHLDFRPLALAALLLSVLVALIVVVGALLWIPHLDLNYRSVIIEELVAFQIAYEDDPEALRRDPNFNKRLQYYYGQHNLLAYMTKSARSRLSKWTAFTDDYFLKKKIFFDFVSAEMIKMTDGLPWGTWKDPYFKPEPMPPGQTGHDSSLASRE